MRNLIYRLEDGTIVRTYKDAIESNQNFTTLMENVDRPKSELSPKRKAMLAKASLKIKNA